MPDSLKKLTDKRDKENAQYHKLTGDAIVPERASGKRRICMKCRNPDHHVPPQPLFCECGGEFVEMTL